MNQAVAYLRFDRAAGPVRLGAGSAREVIASFAGREGIELVGEFVESKPAKVRTRSIVAGS
jgi:hypothetical protein